MVGVRLFTFFFGYEYLIFPKGFCIYYIYSPSTGEQSSLQPEAGGGAVAVLVGHSYIIRHVAAAKKSCYALVGWFCWVVPSHTESYLTFFEPSFWERQLHGGRNIFLGIKVCLFCCLSWIFMLIWSWGQGLRLLFC